MSAAPLQVNIPAPAARPARQGAGRIWPALIVALFAMNASMVGITVYFATNDKSSAVEPNYYANALKYGDTIREREASNALGWSAEPTLRPSQAGHSMELVIAVTDRQGSPVSGVTVRAVVFASVRASDRQTLSFAPDAPEGGQYASPIRINRSGLWCVRLTATRGTDTFTRQTDLLVPDQPR